ncbi:hypothetical protein DFJ58DRAFT_733203 [Suillus subalutaceus]|uniref:uncharacterized protein n=1 Tax=Suillus subalutaceus TaxID=48586 RepID=UPI001B879842|nr:uncharacterized protein DFJ58DRAFT_733203 [Suillus subalutaceus]KAG1839750.1 hypothetical protein DFJ58DRAFT_733203 [Suillus subalutaceus]
MFETRWPERNCTNNSVPVEGDLTEVEIKKLTAVKDKRKLMIKTWYRWQTNVARLARSGGLKGALDLGETLSRGDERVKGEADAAIKAEGISTRGKKLAKRKDVTRAKYAAENDSIRTELARAGFVQDVEQEEKIRAFNELGAHLDCVFRHLSHKTGGLKFTCIAGGRNPTTGEIVVLDYHLRETEPMLISVKLVLAHDEKMLASALDAGTIADEAANELDEIFGEDSEEDEEEAAEEEENVRENEELGDMDDIGLGLNGLYQFDQVMDDQGSMADLSPAPTATWTTAAVVPDNNIDSLPFNQFDISSLDMIHLNSFLASLPQVPYNPFTAIGPTYGLVDQDLDFSFMHDSSNSFDYQYSPPVIHEPTGHLLPAFPGDTTMPSNLPLSHSNHLPPTTPLASTSSINMTDSNTFDRLAGLEEEGPR